MIRSLITFCLLIVTYCSSAQSFDSLLIPGYTPKQLVWLGKKGYQLGVNEPVHPEIKFHLDNALQRKSAVKRNLLIGGILVTSSAVMMSGALGEEDSEGNYGLVAGSTLTGIPGVFALSLGLVNANLSYSEIWKANHIKRQMMGLPYQFAEYEPNQVKWLAKFDINEKSYGTYDAQVKNQLHVALGQHKTAKKQLGLALELFAAGAALLLAVPLLPQELTGGAAALGIAAFVPCVFVSFSAIDQALLAKKAVRKVGGN